MPFLVTCRELFLETAFPVAATDVVGRPLEQTDFHRHEFFEMLFVVRGSLLNRLSKEEIALKTGDLLITKPFVQHLLEHRQRRRSAAAYCCSFLPRVVDSSIRSLEEIRVSSSPNRHFFKPFLSLADESVSAVLLPIPPGRRKRVTRLFQRLQQGARGRSDSDIARTRCDFLSLLACLADGYELDQHSNQQVEKVFSVPTSRYHEGLRRTLNHIHDHIEEPLTLQGMAAMSGVSVSYFCMLFKHATGMTFLNYLTGLRIDQACALLRDSRDNITDIFYRVGFNDYSHFSRQFKKVTGVTPGDYRRENQSARRIKMF